MILSKMKYSQKISILIFSFVTAVCFACLLLLNLPFFYEQTLNHMLLIFAVTAFAFLIVILLVNKVFITPFLNSYLKDKNLIFVIIMFVILTITLSLGSVYYWNIPIRHAVEICWDSEDLKEDLYIQKLLDSNNNRLHSSSNFGFEKYPFSIETGTCIQGFIIELDPMNPKIYLSTLLKVIVRENPPNGRFYISIDENPSVVTIDRESNYYSNSIMVNEGFERRTLLSFAEHELIYTGIKALAISFCAIYLSLFFFGVTELMFQDTKTTNKS